MKVKDLIEELNKLDPELEVVNYVATGEDCDPLASVNVFDNDTEKLPYVKGDWPEMNGDKVVVLFGGYAPYKKRIL